MKETICDFTCSWKGKPGDCFSYVNFMELNLSETSGNGDSCESDHRMSIFLDLTSRDRFTTLLMAAALSYETLVYV
jgi:hypothetical protein